jgi:hypothetical protein
MIMAYYIPLWPNTLCKIDIPHIWGIWLYRYNGRIIKSGGRFLTTFPMEKVSVNRAQSESSGKKQRFDTPKISTYNIRINIMASEK